ncbi:unnamed protein product [Linum tenue]|uniref:Uncharacterized protein n=1 Tax=Linum tenue TaxID=586396 RepID=A0AAV0MJ86_9ROSI|nr:unnamed protein product [Linum tenue]CAI0467838.1 unnamed protein product [Linum tenue]
MMIDAAVVEKSIDAAVASIEAIPLLGTTTSLAIWEDGRVATRRTEGRRDFAREEVKTLTFLVMIQPFISAIEMVGESIGEQMEKTKDRREGEEIGY